MKQSDAPIMSKATRVQNVNEGSSASNRNFCDMKVARTAVLALAVLSATAVRPASAQTFQERWWSPIPKADAAEKPLPDQDKTSPGMNRQERSQQTSPERSHSHARPAQQQPTAPITQQSAHPRGRMAGNASFYAYATFH